MTLFNSPSGALRLLSLAGVAALCLAAGGCIGATRVTAAEPPPVLCEASYSNFAWNPVVTFTGIAANGQILRFSSRDSSDLQGFGLLELALPDRPRPADIARRYVISAPTGRLVPGDVLQRIVTLAAQARHGTVTREQRGADMGANTLVCFVAVSDSGNLYDTVLIRSDGDWEERNTHPAAVELAALLDSLLAEPAPAAPGESVPGEPAPAPAQ